MVDSWLESVTRSCHKHTSDDSGINCSNHGHSVDYIAKMPGRHSDCLWLSLRWSGVKISPGSEWTARCFSKIALRVVLASRFA